MITTLLLYRTIKKYSRRSKPSQRTRRLGIHSNKIAQLLILPVYSPSIEVVDELSDTDRGDGGFGSSGIRL